MAGADAFMDRLNPEMCVVTAASGTERSGCLVGFSAQCSIEPARYAVWLSKANHTYGVARAVEVLRQQTPHDEVGAYVAPGTVLGADVGYAGVAQDALADAADLLGDLLGGGVVGGGAQLQAFEVPVVEHPLRGGQGGERVGERSQL